jgi:hypothetical protein
VSLELQAIELLPPLLTSPPKFPVTAADMAGGEQFAKLEVSGAQLEWGEIERLVGVPTPLAGSSKQAKEP